MTDYKPGTVAEVTFQGDRYRALRCGTPSNWGWSVAVPESRAWASDSSGYVTDVRPLVVLDLDDYDAEKFSKILRSILRGEGKGGFSGPWARAAHVVAAQIEAQTKPPRIPEPGLWGVVEATTSTGGARRKWLRDGSHKSAEWAALEATMRSEWGHLIDPVLIREGVQ